MDKSLPTFSHKDEIINSVIENDITIISANTGSGKSTQICQYLCEYGYDVIVTEPRRIAAVSLAERVGDEIGNTDIVSYHTGYESTETSKTRILFCTDGLQLVRSLLGVRKTSSKRTRVLILDEIHEWNLNQETLVAWIRFQINNGVPMKVIIMSATLSAASLSDYFPTKTGMVDIPGTLYPVERVNCAANDLHCAIKDCISKNHNTLVFLPGKSDIENECRVFSDMPGVDVIPLHGELSINDQKKIFKPSSKTKLIFATNIAQTSITVPDIDVVVDTGLEKRIECYNGVQGLYNHNISKADCTQRAGRAGRVKAGKYYLCSDFDYDNRSDYGESDMERCLLDQVVLKLAAIDLDARDMTFYHQPSMDMLRESYKILDLMRALDHDTHSITPIGARMAVMSVSARYARMIIEAEKYNIVDPTLKIVSMLEVGNIFVKDVSYPRDILINSPESDIHAMLLLFNWCSSHNFNDFNTYGISVKSYRLYTNLYHKLYDSVSRVSNVSKTGDVSNLKYVYLSGMIDRIGVCSWSDVSYGENRYDLSNQSVIGVRGNRLIIGSPLVIQIRGRYNTTNEKYLFQNCCQIDVEDIDVVYPNSTTYEDSATYYDYDSYTGIVNSTRSYFMRGQLLCSKSVELSSGPVFEKVKVEYEEHERSVREAEERLKASMNSYAPHIFSDTFSSHSYRHDEPTDTIVIGGKSFSLEYNYSLMVSNCVYLDEDDIIALKDTDTVSTKDGCSVTFKYHGYTSSSISELYKRVYNNRKETNVGLVIKEFPTYKANTLSEIGEYLNQIGSTEIEVLDESVTIYVGLIQKNKGVCFKVFYNFEDYSQNVISVMRTHLMLYINDMYSVKKFIEAYPDKEYGISLGPNDYSKFQKSTELLFDEITCDNYGDILDMVDSMFNECVYKSHAC